MNKEMNIFSKETMSGIVEVSTIQGIFYTCQSGNLLHCAVPAANCWQQLTWSLTEQAKNCRASYNFHLIISYTFLDLVAFDSSSGSFEPIKSFGSLSHFVLRRIIASDRTMADLKTHIKVCPSM